jgi:N-methylhydantoinase B
MAAGQWRVGIGAILEFTFLDDAGFSLEGEGHAFTPWGFKSGADGHTASLTLKRPDGTKQILPSKVQYLMVKAGNKLISSGLAAAVTETPHYDHPKRSPLMLQTV